MKNSILIYTLILISLSVTITIPGVQGQSSVPTEYEVKAVFLYNFTQFMELPPTVMENRDTLKICILGKDPFGPALQIFNGEIVHNKKLLINLINNEENAYGCNFIYISDSEKRQIRRIMEKLSAMSVVTISDMEGFARSGGIIKFIIKNNKVHFMINLDAADRSGIKIRSRLLQISTIYREGKADE